MQDKHTYRVHKRLAYGIAITSLICSFWMWTGFVALHSATEYKEQQHAAAPSYYPVADGFIAEEQVADALEELSSDPEIVDTEPEEEVSDPVVEEEELVETSAEPDLSASVITVQNENLDDWELKRYYSLSIPSLNVHAPVFLPSLQYWNSQKWDLLEEQMQVGLSHGAVAYPHSVAAGSNGNLIIAGHSSPPDERAEQSRFGHLFASIPNLNQGDTVTVLRNGSYTDYEVQGKEVVSPNETSILAPQYDESILKLVTCYPVGTTKNRMVVTAVRKNAG